MVSFPPSSSFPSFLLFFFSLAVEQTAQQHIFHHQSFAEGNSPPLLHFFLMFTDRKANGLCRTGTEASWGQTTEPTPLAKGSRGSTCSGAQCKPWHRSVGWTEGCTAAARAMYGGDELWGCKGRGGEGWALRVPCQHGSLSATSSRLAASV